MLVLNHSSVTLSWFPAGLGVYVYLICRGGYFRYAIDLILLPACVSEQGNVIYLVSIYIYTYACVKKIVV